MIYKFNIIIIVIIFTFIFFGCRNIKYSIEFKENKKHTDSYFLFQPIVELKKVNNNKATVDSVLSSTTEEIIKNKTVTLLSNKFSLTQINEQIFNKAVLNDLYIQIDNIKEKTLQDILIDSIIAFNYQIKGNKYGILVSINGFYNPDYSPHYNLTAGIATNSVIINPYTKPHLSFRVLVIDVEKKQVVYYDKALTSNYDPRLKTEIEELVVLKLKKIYYR